MIPHRLRLAGSVAGAGLLIVAASGSVAAHTIAHAGPYTIEIGWQHEPTYLGETNGVAVIIHDADDKPINDLTAGDLKVVVSTGDQQSAELTFEPGFDPIELEGPLGEYDAPVLPTAPGDYTFHLTGSIHGQAVDLTVTSGPETFDTVKGTSDLEFPNKLPALSEVVTRLDRIDARVAAAQAPAGPTQASVDAATAQASDAKKAADQALLIGAGVGLAGLVVGVIGVLLAMRASRRVGS